MYTWKISGTAVQGRRHIENNTPCQDKIFSLRKNGVTAIALADGAGSASLSHYGAESAVKVICEKLCSDFDVMINNPDAETVKRDILDAVISELYALSRDMKCGIKDLGSTLLAAASDDRSIMLLHLGDGVIGCSRRGETVAISLPDNGEYKNTTFFTSSHDALFRLRVSKGSVSGISGIVLMSDGSGDSFFHGDKFAGILEEIKQKSIMYPEEDMNDELRGLFDEVVKENTRDDCSLIMMSRPDEYFRGYRDLDEADQYSFIGVNTAQAKENREKILGIIAGQSELSRAKIIEVAKLHGLKRKQVLGLLRELSKKGLIRKRSLLSRSYSLNFYF